MKSTKLLIAVSLILLLALSLFACGGAAGEAMSDSMNSSAGYDKGYDYDYVETPSEPSKVPEYGYDGSYPTGDSADDSIAGGAVVGDAAQMSEKIIRNVTIDAQTKEYDKAVDEIRAAVGTMGGFEESFRSSGRSYYQNGVYSRSAHMVLRLPADQLDAFLGQVGGMVNVLSQSATAQNVTGEYYDIKARLSVLESERAAYEDMLKKATDIEYVLQIKDRLYNVIEEMEAYQARLNVLDSKVSYSTVTISLSEVIEYTPVITEEPTFGERVGEAFTESWEDFAEGCKDFAVWFVYALPTILVLVVINVVAIVIIVTSVRRGKRKRAAAVADKTEDAPKNDK